MNEQKKIKRGAINTQAGDGQLVTQMALTKTASTTVDGELLTNRQYLSGRYPWNKKTGYLPVIRVNGVVSGCVVSGDAVNDNVQLSAGVANVNGVVVAVGADTTVAITRGAASKYAVSAVCVDNAGTVSVVKGTDGDALNLTGFDGAGKKPLTAVTLAVLAYVVTFGDAAAVIPNSDIYLGEDGNAYNIVDSLRGGVVLSQALELNKTGAVSRAVYASFYDISASLVPVAKIEDGTLMLTRGTNVAIKNNDSNWTKREFIPDFDWNVSVKKGRTDQYWVDKMLDPNSDKFYLTMQEDTADAFSYRGFALLSGGLNLSVKKGVVVEDLKFEADGELIRS